MVIYLDRSVIGLHIMHFLLCQSLNHTMFVNGGGREGGRGERLLNTTTNCPYNHNSTIPFDAV